MSQVTRKQVKIAALQISEVRSPSSAAVNLLFQATIIAEFQGIFTDIAEPEIQCASPSGVFNTQFARINGWFGFLCLY